MIRIFTHKAQKTVEPIEDVQITFDTPIPTLKTLGDQNFTFERDAIELCNTLERVLPGGTFDRLLVEMMKRKVSSFIVPIKD